MNRRPVELPERIPAAAPPALAREDFYRRFPPAAFVAELERRRRPTRQPWLVAATAAAMAVVAVLVVRVGPWTTGRRVEPPEVPGSFGTAGAVRDKGRAPEPGSVAATLVSSLHVQVRSGERFVGLENGTELPANALLRFAYDTKGADWLYLFSVDAKGVITTYYPEGRGFSVPIARGRNIPLPDGVLLDDYVGHERFFALFSSRPLSTLEVDLAVHMELVRLWSDGRGVEDLERLPLDCHQETLHIVKR